MAIYRTGKLLKRLKYVRAISMDVINDVESSHPLYGKVEITFHRNLATFSSERPGAINNTYIRKKASKYVDKFRMMGLKCYPFGFWGDHSQNWLLQFYTKNPLELLSEAFDSILGGWSGVLFLVFLFIYFWKDRQ